MRAPSAPVDRSRRAPRTPTSLPLGRDSVTYRLMLEPFNVVVGGPRALLLQVMHPAVGAGVAQHSDYERDPWTRLVRTLQTMTQLALGTPERSREMARLLRKSHATINGVCDDGQPYRALDPANMRWVWATLLDTLMAVADNFVRPLTPTERTRLYDEWLLIAEACGVARADCPPDVDAFARYVTEVIDGELEATTTARGIAAMLRRPPLPAPLRQMAASVLGIVLPGQLPVRLRDAIGLRWDRVDQAAFDAIAFGSRAFCRVTPGPLRRLPGAVATLGTLRAPALRPRRRLQPSLA